MPRKKTEKPEFYQTFMREGFFPNSNKIVRFDESKNYWIFKTGTKIFKVKKKEDVQSSVQLDELFCSEIVHQIQQHSPSLEAHVVAIKQQQNAFIIDWNNSLPSEPLYYAISMNQLTEKGFLSNIISKGKVTESILEKVCSHLISFHKATTISQSKDDGSTDALRSKLDDLFYQSKKHLNVTISKAMIDMTFRPLEKYLSDNRRAFSRRLKQEKIRRIHGCFVPRKIHVAKEGICFLGRSTNLIKSRYNDVASDIADLTVNLQIAKLGTLSDYFADKYAEIAEDEEIKIVLPMYQAFRCMQLGLEYSVQAKQTENQDYPEWKQLAIKHYEQTIEVVRGL